MKRKTEFVMSLRRSVDGSWGYDFLNIKKNRHSDQGQHNNQLTNLLADAILYINRYKVEPPKKQSF